MAAPPVAEPAIPIANLGDSTVSREHPVSVVGAGPAGLAAAIDLALRGFAVNVWERRRPPLDKPCGEGLMPDGLERLRALGVSLRSEWVHPFHGICYFDGDHRAIGKFSGGPGLGVRRLKLHRALVERAEQVGAQIHWGCRVTEVDHQTATISLQDSKQIKSRYVVIADGLRSAFRQNLARQTTDSSRDSRFGIRRHFMVEPWSPWVEVYWGEGAEAYVTPVGKTEVGVAVLWNRRQIPPAEAGWDQLIGLFPRLQSRLAGRSPASKTMGIGPLRQSVKKAVVGKAVLLGDAGGYVDAITGEGLSIAFHETAALGEALEKDNLKLFAARRRQIRRLPEGMTELLLWLEPRWRLRRRVVAALESKPEMFNRFLDVHTRRRSLWSVTPWLPRLILQLILSR